MFTKPHITVSVPEQLR